MNHAVEEIKSRINVVDLIGEYIRLQKGGANWKALCPFHGEKSPSFMVNEEKQFWHCFGCGKGGDAFAFVMEMESLDFKETLKMLAERTGVELGQYQGHSQDQSFDKGKILEILELAAKFYEKQLWDGAGKGKIGDYLKKRGLTDESLKNFRVGYAPAGWRNILTFLTGRGYKIEDIIKTGLLVEKQDSNSKNSDNYYDRFRDRITFPIRDVMGKVVGFSARVAPGGDESQAKYVNTPETPVYHKSKALYGIDRAKQEIKKMNFTLVVEGNTDVIAAHQAGVLNTVAISGTALTPDQLDILKRYSENIKMLFDMDEAGRQATLRSSELAFQKDINLSIVTLSEGKDAAELAEKDPQKFLEDVKRSAPAMEYFLNYFSQKFDPSKVENKKIIARESLELIAYFKSDIEKEHWIKKLSETIAVDEKTLFKALPKKSGIPDGEKNAEIEEAVAGTRLDVIRENIIGLMLGYPEIWSAMAEKEEKSFFAGNTRMKVLLERGKEFDFSFDRFISAMENESAEAAYYQKKYFETKYRMNDKGEVAEIVLENPKELLDQNLEEARKEIQKNKKVAMEDSIREAERAGDKERVKALMEEFSKL